MDRQNIPYRIEEFTDAIEKIFGNGAKILEIQIMKCLFKKVGYKLKHYPKRENITFTEYITAVKRGKNNHGNVRKKQPKLKDKLRTDTLGRSRKESNWISKGFSGIAPF
jgi:hypothetical protein